MTKTAQPLAMEHDLALLRPDQAAQALGVSTHSLARWRRLEKGPPFTRIGPNRVGYPRGKLRAWIEERTED